MTEMSHFCFKSLHAPATFLPESIPTPAMCATRLRLQLSCQNSGRTLMNRWRAAGLRFKDIGAAKIGVIRVSCFSLSEKLLLSQAWWHPRDIKAIDDLNIGDEAIPSWAKEVLCKLKINTPVKANIYFQERGLESKMYTPFQKTTSSEVIDKVKAPSKRLSCKFELWKERFGENYVPGSSLSSK